jgi:hypothetical protein
VGVGRVLVGKRGAGACEVNENEASPRTRRVASNANRKIVDSVRAILAPGMTFHGVEVTDER